MSVFDLINEPTGPTADEQLAAQMGKVTGASDNVLTRSLRGGVYGAGSQLADLGGLVAENLDAPEQAASLRASAAGLKGRAALPQNAPRISSFKQLRADPSLDNAGEYLGGLIGGSLPYMGAGIAGGLATGGAGVIPAALGATAALAPFEAGDVVQKQMADPQAMQATPGSRLRDAALFGTGAAALQSIVPVAVAGKIAGRSGRNILPSNFAAVPVEGVTEGSGEAIKQIGANQDKPLNWEAIGENAIGGVAAGGVFAGIGATADAARGVVPGAAKGVANLASKAGTGIGGATDAAWTSTKAAGEAAGKISRKAWDSTKDVMPEGMKDTVEAAGTWVADKYKNDVKGAMQQARDWGTEIVNDPNTPADVKKGLTAAMTNLRDRTTMATVVAAKFARDKLNAVKTPEPETAPKTPLEEINRFRDEAPDETREMESAAKGEPIGGVKQFEGMDDTQIRDTLDRSDKSLLQRANDWAIKMAEDAGYDQAERDRITEMWGEKKDTAQAAAVATAAAAWSKSKKYGKKIEDLAQTLRKTEDEPGVKKSEDLSGFRSAMQDAVIPYLKKNMPHLFSTNTTVEARPGQVPMIHPSNFDMTADALNRTVTEMSQGRLTSTQMAKLIDVFGEHTMPVMERVLAATGRSLGRGGKTNDVWKMGDARQEPTNGKGRMGENNTMQAQLENLMRENESEPSDPTTQQFMELSRLVMRKADAERIVRNGFTPEKAAQYEGRDIKPLIDAYQKWADGMHLTRVVGSRTGAPAPKGGYPKTGDLFESPKAKSGPSAIKDPDAPVPAGKTEGGKGADGQTYPAGESLFQTEAGRYNEEAIRRQFAEDFGENADMVAKALEERAAAKYREEPTEGVHYDADGKPIEEAELERVVRGGGWKSFDRNGEGNEINRGEFATDRDGKMIRDDKRVESMVRDPARFYAEGRKGFNKTHQLIVAMEREFPTHNVKWEQAEQATKGWGYVVAERQADPDKLSHADLANMKADVSVDPETRQSRIRKEDMIVVQTPGGARVELDSLRSAWAMDKKMPYAKGSDDAMDRGRGGASAKENYSATGGKAQRVAQAALEAVSRIIDSFGSKERPINIDPNARVGVLGKDAKGDTIYLLWKDVGRYLNPDAKPDEALRMQNLTSMTADRWKAMTPEQRAEHVREVNEREAMDARNQNNDARDRSIINEGRPEDNLVKDALRNDGRYGTNKDDNILMAAGDRSAAELVRTSNEDGTASASFRMLTKQENQKVNKFFNETLNYWYDVKTPAAQTLVTKAELLIKHTMSAMSARDRQEFLSYSNERKPSAAAETVNRLYEKYYYALPEETKNPTPRVQVKGASAKLKAAGWDEQNMPMPTESTGEGKMVALGEDGKPVTVKPTVTYGEPVGLMAMQQAMEKLSPIQVRALTKAQDLGNLSKEVVTKNGRFYIESKGDSFDIRFAPVVKGTKGEKKSPPPPREDLGPTPVRPGPTLEEGIGRASKEMPQSAWVEESNRPKAVAAKKAALLEAASSSNPDLFRELSTSTDAKALQRAVDTLVNAEAPKGTLPSRSSVRAAVQVSNKFRGNVTTLSNMLMVMSREPSQYLSPGQMFSRENFRNHPEVKAEMAGLLAGRLQGDPDAARALDALRHVEYQHFSMEKSVRTNEALAATLNTKVRGKLGDYMDTIANSNDVPLIMREIARKIKDVAADTRVTGVADMTGAMGLYYPIENKIEIGKGYQNPAQLLLHEGAHAATIRALAKNEPLAKATYELMEHVAFVSKRTANAYAMTDTAEFLAEGLSNRDFQKELQSMPPSSKVRTFLGDNIANAWQEFVAVVRSALKLEPKHDSALSQLFELAGHAMKEVKADPVKGYSLAEGQAWHDQLFANVSDFRKTIDGILDYMPASFLQGRADFEALISKAEADRGVTYGEQHTADQILAALDLRKDEGVDVFGKNPELIQTLLDAIGEGRLGDRLNMPAEGVAGAIETANKRIAELIKADPDVAYGLQTKRYSMESAQPVGTKTVSQRAEKAVRKFVERTLGPNAEVLFEPMTNAGSFFRDSARQMDVLRVAVTALNPLATAHHEALHGFFGHLRASGMNDATHVVEKYSGSAHIMTQLRERLKDSPEALKQLADPEERAAYMFQYYKTDPTFKLMPRAKNFFAKVSEVLHNLMGMWTNDQRAQHIMDYFERGEFATDMGNMDTVHDKLMKTGRNALLEKAKSWVEPMGRLGDSLAGMGGNRLRDTGIPALAKIADLVKTTGRGQGGDRGHLPAARVERSVRLNAYAAEMSRFTAEEHRDALEAMQNGTKATGRARVVQLTTERTLDSMFAYMKDKGVDISLLADKTGAHYFPRVWDAHYIATNKDAFLAMMEKYTRSGEFAGDPREVMRNIVSSEGSSFNIVTRQPGMQAKKERLLRFIDHADAAPFLRKDLMETMDSYVTQGTRRAEWAERFGDDAKGLEQLLEQARKQGATQAQIIAAETYLKGVGGTLGDDIDPGLRRLYGNAIIYQNIRLLPLAVFSSLVDPLGIAVRGGTAREALGAFKRGIKEIPQGFKDLDNRTKTPAESTAELLGVIDNAYLHSTLGTLYNQGLVGDFGRNLNDKFFKYNLMEQFNRSMRSAATASAIKFIETHASGKASKHSSRWIQELGLEVGAVDLKADGSLKLYETDGLSKEKAERIKQAVNQWVDGAVLRPDAADKPIWMNDPHFALLSHLKQFTWSFQETILKRVVHEYGYGNYGPALALASYVPMMIAADAAKGALQTGGDEPDWKKNWGPAEYVSHGMQRAGLFGVSQYAIDAYSAVQRGGTGLGGLSGPMLEQMGEAVSVAGGRREFSSFLMRSLPANAVYSDWVKDTGGPDNGPPVVAGVE